MRHRMNTRRLGPVSYTHLDVYKRQEHHGANHGRNSGSVAYSLHTCFSVSYTHLDVYKRQVYRYEQLHSV